MTEAIVERTPGLFRITETIRAKIKPLFEPPSPRPLIDLAELSALEDAAPESLSVATEAEKKLNNRGIKVAETIGAYAATAASVYVFRKVFEQIQGLPSGNTQVEQTIIGLFAAAVYGITSLAIVNNLASEAAHFVIHPALRSKMSGDIAAWKQSEGIS